MLIAAGIQAEHKIKTGALVPDTMMLRLIVNELTTRGWLASDSVRPYAVYSSPAASSIDSGIDMVADSSIEFGGGPKRASDSAARDTISDTVDAVTVPSPVPTSPYTYSDHPAASFILDGFPRTAQQAAQLDHLIPINLVVSIKTPAAVIVGRICHRWVHAPSGRVYNTTFNPPKVAGFDNVTGEPLTRRDDDDPAVWTARLRQFEHTSRPLLDHYARLGVLCEVAGNCSDDITPQIVAEVERRFGKREQD